MLFKRINIDYYTLKFWQYLKNVHLNAFSVKKYMALIEILENFITFMALSAKKVPDTWPRLVYKAVMMLAFLSLHGPNIT